MRGRTGRPVPDRPAWGCPGGRVSRAGAGPGGHAGSGRRRGMGTAVSGQRFRLTRASLCSRAMAPGSSSPGRVSMTPPAIIPSMSCAPCVGPDDGEGPVVEGADAAGGDVGVLGGEVRAGLAALPGPGVGLLQRDLVVAAVARPDLEDALDVHLGDVGPGEAVLGLEELGEDGVVEGLGAQEPDGQARALRAILPALRACITGAAEAWHPMPTRAMRSAPPSMAWG